MTKGGIRRGAELKWSLGAGAVSVAEQLRAELGPELYAGVRSAIKKQVRKYVLAEEKCAGRQGRSVSPLGGSRNGYRRIKLWVALPGFGKRGSLRVGLALNCKTREAIVAGAFIRSNDPTTKEYDGAFRESGA